MSTQLRIIENPGFRYAGKVQAGDMWHIPGWDQPDRECWAIVLPNMHTWRTTDTAGGDGLQWGVSGVPPNITVTPSIDDRDPAAPWHGFITNGVMDP